MASILDAIRLAARVAPLLFCLAAPPALGAEAPTGHAKVKEVLGDCAYREPGQGGWTKLVVGQALKPGAELKCAPSGQVSIAFPGAGNSKVLNGNLVRPIAYTVPATQTHPTEDVHKNLGGRYSKLDAKEAPTVKLGALGVPLASEYRQESISQAFAATVYPELPRAGTSGTGALPRALVQTLTARGGIASATAMRADFRDHKFEALVETEVLVARTVNAPGRAPTYSGKNLVRHAVVDPDDVLATDLPAQPGLNARIYTISACTGSVIEAPSDSDDVYLAQASEGPNGAARAGVSATQLRGSSLRIFGDASHERPGPLGDDPQAATAGSSIISIASPLRSDVISIQPWTQWFASVPLRTESPTGSSIAMLSDEIWDVQLTRMESGVTPTLTPWRARAFSGQQRIEWPAPDSSRSVWPERLLDRIGIGESCKLEPFAVQGQLQNCVKPMSMCMPELFKASLVKLTSRE